MIASRISPGVRKIESRMDFFDHLLENFQMHPIPVRAVAGPSDLAQAEVRGRAGERQPDRRRRKGAHGPFWRWHEKGQEVYVVIFTCASSSLVSCPLRYN